MFCFCSAISFGKHHALLDHSLSVSLLQGYACQIRLQAPRDSCHVISLRASMCFLADSKYKRNFWRHPADAASLGPLS